MTIKQVHRRLEHFDLLGRTWYFLCFLDCISASFERSYVRVNFQELVHGRADVVIEVLYFSILVSKKHEVIAESTLAFE